MYKPAPAESPEGRWMSWFDGLLLFLFSTQRKQSSYRNPRCGSQDAGQRKNKIRKVIKQKGCLCTLSLVLSSTCCQPSPNLRAGSVRQEAYHLFRHDSDHRPQISSDGINMMVRKYGTRPGQGFSFYYISFLCFLGLPLRHMEVPTLNRSCSCRPTPQPQPQPHWI